MCYRNVAVMAAILLKFGITILLVVMLAGICSAETLEFLYDDWVPYGKNFSAKEHTLIITGQSTMAEFVVNLPTGSTIAISSAGCYSRDNFIVCYNGSREVDWVNYTLDKEYWKAYINISLYKEAAKGLEISKSYESKDPILVQEPIVLTIKIFNNASSAAKGIILKDSVPQEFKITHALGCEYFGTNIRWYGSLNPGESHMCKYTIEALSNTTYSTPATVDYILDDFEKTAVSDTINLTIAVPRLKADLSLSNNTLKIGDILLYSLNLTNLDEEQDMSINRMNVYIPKNIRILQYHHKFKESLYGLSFNGYIEKNETIVIWFSGGVIQIGNRSINTTIDYTVRGVFTQISLYEPIFIDYDGELPLNVSFDNITNISVNISDNMTLEENVSLDEILEENVSLDETAGEVSNIAVPAQVEPIVHTVEGKKPISYPVVIGIILVIVIGFSILVFIKKRKSSYY